MLQCQVLYCKVKKESELPLGCMSRSCRSSTNIRYYAVVENALKNHEAEVPTLLSTSALFLSTSKEFHQCAELTGGGVWGCVYIHTHPPYIDNLDYCHG